MKIRIPIYTDDEYKKKRIFDVETDEYGNVKRYMCQNIRNHICVDAQSMQKQIDLYLKNRIG